jgi:hypothetical protein
MFLMTLLYLMMMMMMMMMTVGTSMTYPDSEWKTFHRRTELRLSFVNSASMARMSNEIGMEICRALWMTFLLFVEAQLLTPGTSTASIPSYNILESTTRCLTPFKSCRHSKVPR